MSGKNERKNGFIIQAGILAAAGLVSRIIGLLYRSPLHRVIGSAGLGYYSIAYDYYMIILLISSYSIPSAISKVIAQKLAVKEFGNAHRIFRCAIWYVLAVGGAAGLFLYFGAGIFVRPEVVPVLRTFAPTIFVYGILGVLRGYFQAHKSMIQTSISQILEQIVNAAVTIGAAYLLINSAMGSMEVPADEAGQMRRATYGAVGSAMGTGAGVLAALLFMAGIYAINSKIIKKRIRKDRHGEVDSYGSIMRTITLVVTPFILNTAVNNMSGTVNNTIYCKILPSLRKLDDSAVLAMNAGWGVFKGQAQTISNIPNAFATAMAAAMIPTVAQLAAARDFEGAREKIGLAVKTTMIISIPCAVGLFVLARPVTGLLFTNTRQDEDLATGLLMALSLSVIFYALSALNSQILQGLGKVNRPIINAGIGLAVQTATALGLFIFTDLDLYCIVAANTMYSGVVCVLNQRAVRKAVGYRQELLKTFILPVVASLSMGATAWAVYESLLMLTASPKISVVAAIILAAFVYFAMLLLLRDLTEEELRGFPKGGALVRLAKKCGLMH